MLAATSDAIFAVASWARSVSCTPASALSISESGQRVTPSPYGRQRPISTFASPSSAVRSSRTSLALADSRVADDGHQRRPPLATDLLERRAERCELVVAADERRRDSGHLSGLSRSPRSMDAPGGDRAGLPLQRERLVDRPELELRADRAGRAVGEDDRSGLCSLLKARGLADGVARDVQVVARCP